MYFRYNHRLSHLFILFIITFLCADVSGQINAVSEQNNQDSERIDDISDLRYLAFGSSKTWGAGLKNRSDAYPYLLSSKAANLALRATGPNYPSICTQSMVGNEIYDVIMLEYFELAHDGVIALSQRLRKRFPDAVIIFVQQWHPKMIRYKGNGKDILMDEWLSEKGLAGNNSKLIEAIEETSSQDWYFKPEVLDARMRVLENAAKAVNGYILKGPPYPLDNYEEIDMKDLMLSTMTMFGNDWFHPSKEGHHSIAQGVKELLHKIPVKRSDQVGTWGKGDLCHKWYENGKIDIPYSNDVTLTRFKTGKYALQFPFTSKGGNMRISNPFEEPRSLVITYMTTGPSTTIYPKTKVHIHNSLSKDVIIDPITKDYNFPVHVSSCTNVGMVAPGGNVVSILPLETTEQPFRIVAAALISGDEHISSHNFLGGSHK